jgi:hypothetical protein
MSDFGFGKKQELANQMDLTAKIKSPLIFYDKDEAKIKPIYIVEDQPNDKYRFAILRTTENGKYVRSGMLYFKINGTSIFTDINNAIFVDLENNTVFVKEYEKVLEDINPVNPEERQYIIMMKCSTDLEDEAYMWEAMSGRTTMYNYIVDNIDSLNIDPKESFVLTENVPYKDALTVEKFIKYLKNGDMVPDDGFDIEEYII